MQSSVRLGDKTFRSPRGVVVSHCTHAGDKFAITYKVSTLGYLYWPAAPHGSVASAASVCAVYVDMGLSSNNPVVLTVVTAGTSFSRTFSVKITQIECDTLAKGDNNKIF